MADTVLTFTIPEAKATELKEHFLLLHPNNERDENGDLIYTDNAWCKELVRRFIRDTAAAGKRAKARSEISNTVDDSVVT